MTNKQIIPTNPLATLHQEVDRLFGSFFDDFSLPRLHFRNGLEAPKIDFKETEKEYQLDAELPGVPAKDVQVSVANGVLTIKGEKSSEKEEKGRNYLRVERAYGGFERSLALPEDADDAKIAATSKDGVLSLVIPKKAGAKPETRRIEVKPAA
ncbi:MAG TPA: Hsp20/alpha crystallin family protein [Ferrovibrio sp.]|uniref:Hsp20/alpha crystallin family protein n=1 Tax=Ferrovibrio sp. TaxID=1917215 RepID=UPI002ED6B032